MARKSKNRLNKLESKAPPNADTIPSEIQLVGVGKDGAETVRCTIPIRRPSNANK